MMFFDLDILKPYRDRRNGGILAIIKASGAIVHTHQLKNHPPQITGSEEKKPQKYSIKVLTTISNSSKYHHTYFSYKI